MLHQIVAPMRSRTKSPTTLAMTQSRHKFLSTIKGRLAVGVLFVLIMCAGIVFYYSPMITNVDGPSGDGRRIFNHLELVNYADSFYPLWNPYILGGIPTFADPERFVLLGKLLSVRSPSANLHLNLLLVGLVVLLAFSAFILAREISISRAGALMVGLTIACSQVIKLQADVGRVYLLLSLSLMIFALVLYKRFVEKRNLWLGFLVAVLSGLFVSNIGYYAALIYVPALFMVGLYSNAKTRSLPRAGLVTLSQMTAFFLLGLVCTSVFTLPLLYYQTPSLANYYSPSTHMANLSTFFNIAFPLDFERNMLSRQSMFPFLSLATIPLLTFFFLNRRSLRERPVLIFLCLSAGYLILLFGNLYPFRYLILILHKLPIIGSGRLYLSSALVFTISTVFMLGFGYDAIDSHEASGRWKKLIPLIIVLSSLIAAIFLDVIRTFLREGKIDSLTVIQQSALLKFVRPNGWKMWVLLGVLCLPYTSWKSKRLIKGYVLLLIAVQLLYVGSDSTPFYHRPFNKNHIPKIARILRADKSYYQVLNLEPLISVGIPKIRRMNAFSMYFSREHRWQLEALLARPVEVARPHWVWYEWWKRMPPVTSWNHQVLSLLNIKYLIANQSHAKGFEEQWDLIVVDRNNVTLWERKDWKSSLIMVDRWEVAPRVKEVLDYIKSPASEPRQFVFLGEAPSISLGEQEEELEYAIQIQNYETNRMTLKTVSNKNAIVLIPEYYDSGWRATVNGRAEKVIRANASYRGVPVPKGENLIELYYSPTIVHVGLGITILSLGLSVVAICLSKKKFEMKDNGVRETSQDYVEKKASLRSLKLFASRISPAKR